MRAVFPDDRLMLKEHFRCVEPIIQFSMQFYPEKMLPLRIPAHERLDPPLIDIYRPHGAGKSAARSIAAEADLIVDEIANLYRAADARAGRSESFRSSARNRPSIRSRLSEAIGEEIMQRHSMLCGDSATFQGTNGTSFPVDGRGSSRQDPLTMLRYERLTLRCHARAIESFWSVP